jgi:HAD superfamily hydrolase (TIGR01549 family)
VIDAARMSDPARAVTFDFGQTLGELDAAMLARRLRERGVEVAVDRLEDATPAAWSAYNRGVREGLGGHPWRLLMDTLLATAGVTEGRAAHVEWLWTEQPKVNLWRRPIAGMIELVRDLRAAGVPVGVVSNSEGRLAQLIDEMGWTADLPIVADSGVLGIEKPSPEIFHWTAARLGVEASACVHVGDAWAADFVGALDAGMRAVLFRGAASRIEGDPRLGDPRAAECDDAMTLRAILRAWSLPV